MIHVHTATSGVRNSRKFITCKIFITCSIIRVVMQKHKNMFRRKRKPLLYRTRIRPWIHQWNAKIHLDMCLSPQQRERVTLTDIKEKLVQANNVSKVQLSVDERAAAHANVRLWPSYWGRRTWRAGGNALRRSTTSHFHVRVQVVGCDVARFPFSKN